jgi:hypothetical protein
MPYVHLANGDVKQVDAKVFADVFGDEPPRVFRDNGVEHVVIGVYPDEVEYDTSVDEATQKENDDRAEYEEWKSKRDKKAAKKDEDDNE